MSGSRDRARDPVLSLLAQRYPALDITLDVVDRRVDLINENIDLAVRMGDVDEPHLAAHLIAESSRVLCAAPAYLERRGAPASIAELSQHDCLVLRDSNQAFGVWRLTGPNGSEKVRRPGGCHRTTRRSCVAGPARDTASCCRGGDKCTRTWKPGGWCVAALSASKGAAHPLVAIPSAALSAAPCCFEPYKTCGRSGPRSTPEELAAGSTKRKNKSLKLDKFRRRSVCAMACSFRPNSANRRIKLNNRSL